MTTGGIERTAVEAALNEFKDPELGRSVVQLGQVRDIAAQGDSLSLTLELTTHSAPLWKETQGEAEQFLRAKFPQLKNVRVNLAVHHRPPQRLGQIGLTAKSVIAVGSGKGGVGKSTVAVAIAYGLKRAGCSVGLCDADVYGPSVPHLLGLDTDPENMPRPEVVEKRIRPVMKDGLPVMSIGFMVPPGQAVIWRGPMLHGALTNFLKDTEWGALDYLIIDMPPGTGDIALTLSQLLPLTGSVVVCTPQEVALLDAVKAIAMFRTVHIPVLGMVENMSGFVCPDCNKRYDIFGRGGAKAKAEELQTPFLGEIPINMQIRTGGDAGTPEAMFENPQVGPYIERICYQLAKDLATSARVKPPQPSLPVLG